MAEAKGLEKTLEKIKALYDAERKVAWLRICDDCKDRDITWRGDLHCKLANGEQWCREEICPKLRMETLNWWIEVTRARDGLLYAYLLKKKHRMERIYGTQD